MNNINDSMITLGLYFEVHDADIYGGKGTVGYANINADLCWLTNVWSDGTRHVTYDFYIKGGGWYDTVSDSVLAWMPINKPAPYKPKGWIEWE